MITKINNDDYFDRSVIDIYVDAASELLSLTDVSHSTKAYVIQTGKVMILNGNKEWKEFNIGGGSGSSSLPSVTSEDNNKVLIVKNGEWTVDIAPAIVGSDTEEPAGA